MTNENTPTDADEQFERELEEFRNRFVRAQEEVAKIIVGMGDVVQDVLTSLFCGGSVLLEGVPGIGKTRLVHSLGSALRLQFARIQCTPDLMPADVLGTNVLLEAEDGGRALEFQPGPVFTNLLLVEEINRATPKTQSALLEAMQEHAVTIAGVTRKIDEPFFVLATQNPIEMEGTYPLPEAQLDRFFFKLIVPFPDAEELCTISARTTRESEPTLAPVLDREHIREMQQTVRKVPVAPHVERFASEIIVRSHNDHAEAPSEVKQYIQYGASPRGMQALILGGKVRAILSGRCYVSCDDVRAVTPQALRHRMVRTFEGDAEGIAVDSVVERILEAVGEPGGV